MAKTASREYDFSVFINCPFDRQYLKLFRAVIFAVHDCGYIARCAQEITDTSEVRVSKIFSIISQCRVGIHDISRTELDPRYKLPRFNMPLELGMFLGAKEFGTGKQRRKVCLVLDRDAYRYHKFCSDIGGQDPSAHKRNVKIAIQVVRDFLRTLQPEVTIPGHAEICRRYMAFSSELSSLCKEAKLKKNDLIFSDYTTLVIGWLQARAHP